MKTSTTNPMTDQLRTAQARFDAAKAEVERIIAARPAPVDVTSTAAALDAARRDFEDANAALALGTATDAEVHEAAAALAQAKEEHAAAIAAADLVEMTEAGFRRRLDKAKADLNAAAEARRAVEVEWLRAEVVDADQAYCEAADRLFAAWRRAKSAARAIKSRGDRPNNYTELCQAPVIPPLGAWRDAKTHGIAISEAATVDSFDADRAVQLAAPPIGEGRARDSASGSGSGAVQLQLSVATES